MLVAGVAAASDDRSDKQFLSQQAVASQEHKTAPKHTLNEGGKSTAKNDAKAG